MIEKKRWNIEITMKSGETCAHELAMTEDEFWKLVAKLASLIGNDRAGVYACGGPYGVHLIGEMVSIHYGDDEPPSNVSMGFLGQ